MIQKMIINKEKLGYILYSFADSSFVTIIVTVLFSMYFKDIIVGEKEYGTALWGRTISISMILVAVLAPIMGAIADLSHSRKTMLIISAYTTILFTAFLFFTKKNDILLAMVLFIIANTAFNLATVFYNAFLPEIVKKDELGRFSGISWGAGYLGGLTTLFIILPIISLDLESDLNFRYSFIVVSLFFFIFSLPAFCWLKVRKKNIQRLNSYISIGFKRLIETAKNIRKYKELVKFLISFFIYNDGITVVISFAAIYGSTQFSMTAQEMIIYFIIAQPSSFLGAIIFGYLVDIIGPKNSISISLIIWVLVILGVYFCKSINQFYIIGMCAGFALGSSQSTSRTMFAMLTPKEKTTEFFGFYGVAGRLASIIGPLLYGEISRITGNQQDAIISILGFFIVGYFLLHFVKESQYA